MKLQLKQLAATFGLIGGLGMAAPAAVAGTDAHFKDADEAIEYRQAVFTLVKAHVGVMGAMVKGKMDYDAAEFAYRAESLKALSNMPLEGFTYPGSDKGDTKAKAAVWKDMDGFKAKMEKFQSDSDALAEAAKAGSLDAAKPAFITTVKNCKACHKDYKNK